MTKHHRREIVRLEKALREWRATHKSPTPIPAEIWSSAVDLARQLSVGQISRALHLDHGKLKRLTDRSALAKDPSSSAVATFVEFKAEQFAPPTSAISCALEIESVGGGAMRARLDGITANDLGLVFRAFGS